MKERGIIFNSEMVRAILDGRKTQTRRVMKPQPVPINNGANHVWYCDKIKADLDVKDALQDGIVGWYGLISSVCPFGGVGDRLWVRETWMPDAPRDGTWSDIEFYGCKDSKLSMIPERFRKPEHCIHRASWKGSELVGWTPSIHMPRWASRITLEITGVRVERLQSISEGDAKAEGVIAPDTISSRSVFHLDLWESLYGANTPESWSANPWVWVIEFKRV